MSPITVLSVGPLRQALPARLSMHLEEDNGFRIIEGNGSCSDARHILASEHVDVILLAVNGNKLPRGLKGIIGDGRGRKVLISGDCSRDTILEYIGAGVKGHLNHDLTPSLLKKALRVAHHGEVWFDRRTSSRIAEAYCGRDQEGGAKEVIERLSVREREVLQALTMGYRNRDIADHLHISPQTVKVHLSNIYEKLGVADRLAAVLLMNQSMNGS